MYLQPSLHESANWKEREKFNGTVGGKSNLYSTKFERPLTVTNTMSKRKAEAILAIKEKNDARKKLKPVVVDVSTPATGSGPEDGTDANNPINVLAKETYEDIK